MNIRTKALIGASQAALLMLPAVALAQTGTGEGATGLGEIVVTAQRREERLQNVPISVTALNAAQLSQSGVSTTQDLVTVTPTLTMGQNAGTFLPRLRGVGTLFGAPGVENSVATYIDGVYIAAAPNSMFSLAGIERIEVLKGPQGTLFGRNATGGLIQVITKKPSETFGGTMSASYGNYKTASADVYLTGGLFPGVAMDFAAHVAAQGEGYGRNRFLNIDANRKDRDRAFRSQIMYTGEHTSARLSVDYSETAGSPAEYRRSPFDVSTLGPILQDQDPWDTNASYGVHLTIEHELPFADLVSITAWRGGSLYNRSDADTTPTDGLDVEFQEKDRQFSQEVQLVSKPESRISWLVGAYFFDSNAKYDPVDINFGPILQNPAFPLSRLRTNTSTDTRAYAVFGQVTIPLGEATRLTGGLRYTDEKKTFSAEQFGTLGGVLTIPLGTRPADSVKYNKLTWRASLDHRLSEDVMVYASVNRGFKSGGFNSAGGIADPPFDPETLDAYEVGLKGDFFGGTVRLNPAIFYYDYKNVQVTAFTPQGIPLFRNGPSAEISGLDLDFVWQPFSQLTLRGGLTIIRDRFGDFPGAAFVFSNFPLPGGVEVNAKGNRLPFTPDWASTVAADYVIPVSFGELTASVTYNHSDGYFTEVDNLRGQKAYDLVNASLTVENQGGDLFATLWGRNLLEEEILEQAVGSASLGGIAQYGPPRTFGVTVGAKF
jgi:iron complex outermembrane recepter protein